MTSHKIQSYLNEILKVNLTNKILEMLFKKALFSRKNYLTTKDWCGFMYQVRPDSNHHRLVALNRTLNWFFSKKTKLKKY